jgi:hypothetical protein
MTAHVQAERWVGVGHQARIRRDPQHPPVHAEHEVEDLPWILAGRQQHDRGDQRQNPDEADTARIEVRPAVLPCEQDTRPGEQADDDVVRDGQQPPLH